MVLVVQNVHQISVERMHVVQFREILNDLCETIVETLLREFHFARVKRTDTRYLVSFVHNGRCFSLCFRQHNVDKVLRIKKKIILKYFFHLAQSTHGALFY